MPLPFFSIIVTTHARPALLGRALRSIRRQSFEDYEILLIADEGSAATYEAACRHLREQDVFVKRSGPAGPSRSRNIGLQLARGQFVLFLDDDDAHKEGFLAALRDHIADPKIGAFYCDYEVVTERRAGEPPEIIERRSMSLGSEDPSNLLIYNFIPNNAVCLAAGTAKRLRFDETLRSHEDWEFLIAAREHGVAFRHVPILGVSVHQDEGNAQRNADAKKAAEWPLDLIYIYRKWPAHHPEQRQRRHNALQVLGYDITAAGL